MSNVVCPAALTRALTHASRGESAEGYARGTAVSPATSVRTGSPGPAEVAPPPAWYAPPTASPARVRTPNAAASASPAPASPASRSAPPSRRGSPPRGAQGVEAGARAISPPCPPCLSAPAVERGRLAQSVRVRPGLARMGSTASAVMQVVPGAPPEVVDGLLAEVERAARDARATGTLGFVARHRGTGRLQAVARRLAGPHAAGLDQEQTQRVIAALARPQAMQRVESGPSDHAVLAGGPAAQPSVRPLLWCSDELLRQAHAVCDVTLAVERDDVLVLLLRRTGFALLAALQALETYQHYAHTPGHKHLPDYRRALRARHGWTEERLRNLLNKECGCATR